MKYIIWSNMNLDVKDWIEGYKECLEINDEEVPEEIDEYDLDTWMRETNDMYLDDERMNLNVPTQGRIIAIADLGFWNGRTMGYKMLNHNVNDCLNIEDSCSYAEFYCDRYDVKSTQNHHDGTHYITYREIKPYITPDDWDKFLHKVYDGKATQKDITRYTRSLRPYVKKVYGWR